MRIKISVLCLLLVSVLPAKPKHHAPALQPAWISSEPWAALNVTLDRDTVYVDTARQDIGIHPTSDNSSLTLSVWGQQYMPHEQQVATYHYEFYVTSESIEAPQWRIVYIKTANRHGDQLGADNTSTDWGPVIPNTIAASFYGYVKLRYIAEIVKAQQDSDAQ